MLQVSQTPWLRCDGHPRDPAQYGDDVNRALPAGSTLHGDPQLFQRCLCHCLLLRVSGQGGRAQVALLQRTMEHL